MDELSVSSLLSSLVAPADAPEEKPGVSFAGKSLSLTTAEDAAELVRAVDSCPEGELQWLDLSGNSLGVAAAGALGAALERRPELKRAQWADLFTGRMKTEIPEALSALGKGMMLAQAQLAVLDLSDNAFGPIGVGGLADLLRSPVCTFLQELRLNNNGIGITGAKLLVEALKPMPVHLEVLEMGRNRLENVGAQALAGIIKNLPKLRVLRIPQNGVYLPGVSALCSVLRGCPELRVLDLNDNTVGPKGAAALADTLDRLPRLRTLNLGDCLLKTRGAVVLAEALHKVAELEELNLSFDEVGARAVPILLSALTDRPAVRVLLGGNSLGAEGQRLAALGERVQLRSADGEESDEDVAESGEESESDGADSGASSGDEEDRGTSETADGSLDESGRAQAAEGPARSPAAAFLGNPSRENFRLLGPDPEGVLKEHIKTCPDDISYLDTAAVLVMSLCGLGEAAAAAGLLRALVQWAETGSGRRWVLANSVLTHLELIKSEKKCDLRWDRERCVATFATFVPEAWFPSELRDTLTFFVKLHVEDPKKAKDVDFSKYPQLYKRN